MSRSSVAARQERGLGTYGAQEAREAGRLRDARRRDYLGTPSYGSLNPWDPCMRTAMGHMHKEALGGVGDKTPPGPDAASVATVPPLGSRKDERDWLVFDGFSLTSTGSIGFSPGRTTYLLRAVNPSKDTRAVCQGTDARPLLEALSGGTLGRQKQPLCSAGLAGEMWISLFSAYQPLTVERAYLTSLGMGRELLLGLGLGPTARGGWESRH